MRMNSSVDTKAKSHEGVGEKPEKKPYVPPRVEKKRSVARATLTTGSGATSVGVLGTAPPP